MSNRYQTAVSVRRKTPQDECSTLLRKCLNQWTTLTFEFPNNIWRTGSWILKQLASSNKGLRGFGTTFNTKRVHRYSAQIHHLSEERHESWQTFSIMFPRFGSIESPSVSPDIYQASRFNPAQSNDITVCRHEANIHRGISRHPSAAVLKSCLVVKCRVFEGLFLMSKHSTSHCDVSFTPRKPAGGVTNDCQCVVHWWADRSYGTTGW